MKKILILGIAQSNFLNQLYSSVYDLDNSFEFAIDGYKEFSNETSNLPNLPYQEYFSFKTKPITKWLLYKNTIFLFSERFFWQVLLFDISIGKSFKSIKKNLLSFARARIRVKEYIQPLEYDVFHFHFCSPKNLREIFFLPKDSKIICTFWGSDLMRLTGVSNVFYVSKALEKTDMITLQTPEMVQIFCSKYGHKFLPKLNTLRFVLDDKIFKEIEKNENHLDRINRFKKRFKIPLNKTVIAIGHNAAPENNHIKIIDQLRFLPEKIKEQTVFVLHLSYGSIGMDYISSLSNLAVKEVDINIHIIQDHFNAEEIALFRLCTDILIHLPISDALSSSMTEVLYAGNSVITGAWLPYGVLKRNGIQFQEIEDFEEINNSLESLLDSGHIRSYSQSNKKCIEEFLLKENNTIRWINLFNSLLKRR